MVKKLCPVNCPHFLKLSSCQSFSSNVRRIQKHHALVNIRHYKETNLIGGTSILELDHAFKYL